MSEIIAHGFPGMARWRLQSGFTHCVGSIRWTAQYEHRFGHPLDVNVKENRSHGGSIPQSIE